MQTNFCFTNGTMGIQWCEAGGFEVALPSRTVSWLTMGAYCIVDVE